MKLLQESRIYELPNGGSAHLRVIQPSAAQGTWPGNDYIIRKWDILTKGKAISRPCYADEIKRFEKELGEVTDLRLGEVTDLRLVEHSTLGLVVAVQPSR